MIRDDPAHLLAQRLRTERDRRSWSLADLAERAGVSKAMLSKIERQEVSPTAVILARIATAFGFTLAQLLTPEDVTEQRLVRSEDQPRWQDPKAGYTRRQAFIDRHTGLELADVELPQGASVSFPASVYGNFRQVVWLISGDLTITEDTERHELHAGDRLEFGPPADVTFSNHGVRPCRYLVVLLRK